MFQVWIFGIIERTSGRYLLFPVEKRTAEVLIPLITRHVAKGSRIYSDGWAAYNSLNQLGYEHFTVVHKDAFKKIYR